MIADDEFFGSPDTLSVRCRALNSMGWMSAMGRFQKTGLPERPAGIAALPVQAVKSSRSAIGQGPVGHLIARPMHLAHRKGLPQTKRQAISPNAACSMRRFIA